MYTMIVAMTCVTIFWCLTWQLTDGFTFLGIHGLAKYKVTT